MDVEGQNQRPEPPAAKTENAPEPESESEPKTEERGAADNNSFVFAKGIQIIEAMRRFLKWHSLPISLDPDTNYLLRGVDGGVNAQPATPNKWSGYKYTGDTRTRIKTSELADWIKTVLPQKGKVFTDNGVRPVEAYGADGSV